MADFIHGLGKGYREGRSPYREAIVFGAELNSIDLTGWGGTISIIEPTATFDLSTLTPGHEVAAALLRVVNASPGRYRFRNRWYRNRDNKLIYDLEWEYNAGAGESVFFYTYVGYVDWELWENGAYRVEFAIEGAGSYHRTVDFSVVGIAKEELETPLPAGVWSPIIWSLSGVSSFFYAIYLEALDWVWPFHLVSELFYNLSVGFNDLAWYFSNFFDFIDDLYAKVRQALSWTVIQTLILEWIPGIETISTWVQDIITTINTAVNTWWGNTSSDVLEWINVAIQPFEAVRTAWLDFWQNTWPAWASALEELEASWGNFWQHVLPYLPTWSGITDWWSSRVTEVSQLIDSAFTARGSLWDGWQEIKESVIEFFGDPLEWLWGRFANWFLGPEE